jgi:hypothetical protein
MSNGRILLRAAIGHLTRSPSFLFTTAFGVGGGLELGEGGGVALGVTVGVMLEVR